MEEKKTNSTLFFYVFATTCMFFYIYQANLTFLGLPVITSSVQLSWGIMALYALIVSVIGNNSRRKPSMKSYSTYRKWNKHVRYFLFLFIYALLLLLIVGYGKGDNISEAVVKIFIYGISMFWIWKKMFVNLEVFLKVLLYTGVIQTIVVFYCLINPSFALILDATLNYSPDALSNNMSITEIRELYAGGIGCITSSGLIKYTLTGLIPCTYFCIKKEGWLYLLLFLPLAFCATMLARTGLIFVFILALFIVVKRFHGKSSIQLSVISIIALFLLISLFSSQKYSGFVEERFFRYESLKDDGGKGFFESYFYGDNALYPPINADTFWGIGVTSGKSANGYEVNVDGGPMRLYSAIGVLGSLLFYLFVISNQTKTIKLIINKNNRHLLWLLLVCMIIAEWKEVTYMAFWPVPLFFYLCFLFQLEDCKSQNVRL